MPIRSTRSRPIKQSGTGLARSRVFVKVFIGRHYSGSLSDVKNNRGGSSSKAHREALVERSCICRVEDRVDREAFV